MTFLTVRDLEMRAKLQLLTDQADAKRGRPLTPSEKLKNLHDYVTHCWTCNGAVDVNDEICPTCGEVLM